MRPTIARLKTEARDLVIITVNKTKQQKAMTVRLQTKLDTLGWNLKETFEL